MSQNRISVALPVPLSGGLDYRWDHASAAPAPGTRVKVPLGKREKIGVVIERAGPVSIEDSALKPVVEVLDDEPLFDRELMRALEWAADYYHHPLGEVLHQALPGSLRRGRNATAEPRTAWSLTATIESADLPALERKAPKQAALVELLRSATALGDAALKEAGVSRDSLRRLEQKGLIERIELDEEAAAEPGTGETPPELTADQARAVDAIRASAGYSTALLFGVTGSGKTEVFLRLIDDALNRGRQCLLLVPEIGLTPQLVGRLGARFGRELVVFHSGLSPVARLDAWRRARSGSARLIVGTRSAVFLPLPLAGLIVVDEEHDPSYKQQSGFRYSARDLAIVRARMLDVPIVLASATPSLESFRNAVEGRYRLVSLPQRIGTGGKPSLRIIDMNQHGARQGLSTPLVSAMGEHLEQGHQVLLFINRRGFAPVLFCPDCEKASECGHCDARMTVHARAGQLRCHHCGRREALRWSCPDCGSERIGVGAGTERITSELQALFPGRRVTRLDRDVVAGSDSLAAALAEIESGRASIIVGTQLLTKGHDFPNVTLVGVLNADQGLFGSDFRSEERLAQTIIQVSGRAGRRETRGEVLIQTHYPNHPLLDHLFACDYGAFAERALAERRATGWPPCSHLAVFRAEAPDRDRVFGFLNRLRDHCGPAGLRVRLLGPVPDSMERRDGRFRAHLVLQSGTRPALHALINSCLAELAGWRETRRVRWSIDVDPAEL